MYLKKFCKLSGPKYDLLNDVNVLGHSVVNISEEERKEKIGIVTILGKKHLDIIVKGCFKNASIQLYTLFVENRN